MKVGVVGLGYVGLPLAIELAKKGVTTFGYDVSEQVVANINAREGVTFDISLDDLANVLANKTFTPSTDDAILAECDAILICVPTPLDRARQPDLTYVVSACETIAKHLRTGQTIVMESTTYPGTTTEVIKPILERGGLVAGKDFFLAFSPERIDPGNKTFQVHNTPKIVGGLTPECTARAAEVYKTFLNDVHYVSSPATAEMVKLLENIFRVVNIALVDELTLLCDRMKIDIWEVIDAAKTKPYGYMPFYPGPGVGGHCIPIDPFYLAWKAKEFDFNTRFIEMAGEISDNMPYYVVEKLLRIMNLRGKLLKGARVLLLGLAYKKDIADYRESPSLKLIRVLKDNGAEVIASDPYVPSLTVDGVTYESHELTEDLLTSCDVTMIVTNHSVYDKKMIVEKSALVFDTRNFIDTREHDHVFYL